MNIVDIGINCSTGTETSSLALSEGMSLGVVSVVSDYGGNPYMIEHGVNGLVCPQGDSAKMAGFIELLMDDKELYAQMSRNARARFERELNALSMTRKTNQLYDRLYEKLS
jgi:glycosyltransferase involved in cell wall biosynthesis